MDGSGLKLDICHESDFRLIYVLLGLEWLWISDFADATLLHILSLPWVMEVSFLLCLLP